MLRNILLIVLTSFVLSGCLKGSNGSEEMCSYDPCAVKATANEELAIQSYLTNNGIQGAIKHCSGMYYVIDAPGTGKTPGVCNDVTVNYVGTLTNGNKFDETTSSSGVTFNLRQVILGWKSGIPLIKEGGRIRLFIPPSLGYGNQDQKDRNGNVIIPAGSILIFDVELKQVY